MDRVIVEFGLMFAQLRSGDIQRCCRSLRALRVETAIGGNAGGSRQAPAHQQFIGMLLGGRKSRWPVAR